ncbi:MAG: biotin--[acetyl-CoA-carboxylase] ligase, partial [Anaerolineae bacterium]|nr:biotin--[acetyl-CoA-carboxylase] ligase [Anaerolineae bacterium]
LREGAAAGSAIIADEQRKGRGRKGRIWYTPPGVALAVSVILRPIPAFASRSSIVGALAVYDLCQYVGLDDVGIKWPNDVQVGGKKISGVLPEAVWDGSKLLGVILGMGVNIRNEFDAELMPIATSIEASLGQPVDRLHLLEYLLERVDYWAERMSDAALITTWKGRLSMLGREVSVEEGNSRIVGEAVDVEADGALLIRIANGSIQRVLAGDLVFSSPA